MRRKLQVILIRDDIVGNEPIEEADNVQLGGVVVDRA